MNVDIYGALAGAALGGFIVGGLVFTTATIVLMKLYGC